MATAAGIPVEIPGIEGIRFRHPVGGEDAEAWHAVRSGCIARDQVDLLSASEGLPALQDIRHALAEAADSNRLELRLVAEVDGHMVGCSLVDCWSEDDGRWVYLILGWVLPEWRGRGIGTALLHWGEETSRRLAATEHPGEHFEFAGNASSTEHDSTALLTQEGYSAGYSVLEMKLDHGAVPPVAPLPAGIELRLVLPEHIAVIAASMGEAYRNEYEEGRFQESWHLEESIERLRASRMDPSLWQVAWQGQEVAGQVIPIIEKGRAFFYDVSIRPGWRRLGLARALMTRALRELIRRDEIEIRLNTVAEFRTRARDLYTSLGFRVIKEFPRYRKSPNY